MWKSNMTFQEIADLVERYLDPDSCTEFMEWNDFIDNRQGSIEIDVYRWRCYELDPLIYEPDESDAEAVKELRLMIKTLRDPQATAVPNQWSNKEKIVELEEYLKKSDKTFSLWAQFVSVTLFFLVLLIPNWEMPFDGIISIVSALLCSGLAIRILGHYSFRFWAVLLVLVGLIPHYAIFIELLCCILFWINRALT